MGGQRQAPAALPPGMTRYPLYRRLGEPQGRRYTDYAIYIYIFTKVLFYAFFVVTPLTNLHHAVTYALLFTVQRSLLVHLHLFKSYLWERRFFIYV